MSFLTNIIAAIILILSYISLYLGETLYNMGSLALPASITNQLAVHMLFKKTPLIYGSDIIELRFEDFKLSIKNLVMNQFFDKEGFNKLLTNITKLAISKLKSSMNYKLLYKQLIGAIIASPARNIVTMIGGDSNTRTIERINN